MKKLLSAILAAAMLVCTLMPMASAAIATTTLPTTAGESVIWEAENYADQYYVGSSQRTFSVATKDELSNGQGVYSGSTGNDTVTLTFPVTAAATTVYELECVAGYGGHLDQNYWTIDGDLIFNTSVANGTSLGFKFTGENHYPAGKFITKFIVPEGTHNLTYNLPKRPTQAGAFALDYVKLTATDDPVPEITWDGEATATVKVSDKVAAITFTDAGVEILDTVATPVDNYVIEIYPADTKSTDMVLAYSFAAYTGDKTDEDGNVLTRPTTYTAHIPLTKVLCGTFYAKIYPLGVMRGEPIETEVFTVTDEAAGYSSRYELEDYWVEGLTAPVVSSAYASGGKILFSSQGGDTWTDKASCISDTSSGEWRDTYEVTFEVDLPQAGTYDIETVMGLGTGEYLDLITVSVDDEEIYTNVAANASEDLSVNGSYPWSYIAAQRFNTSKELAAGKHTVKFSIARPSAQAQPHLFMMDYMQFTPEVPALSQSYSTTFEMEDYAGDFIAFDDAGNTVSASPATGISANASGGKFITKDTTFTIGGEQKSVPVKAEIPITVKEDGYYQFEVTDSSAGCSGSLSLTNESGEILPIIEKFSEGVRLSQNGSGLDGADEIRTNFWTYYNVKWHSARYSSNFAYIPAGDYTLTVQYNGREIKAGQSGMAFCIDNVKVTPIDFTVNAAAVSAEGETVIEAEAYADYFLKNNVSGRKANIQENGKASGGKLAYLTETAMETGHYLTIPVQAEKAGWYDMGSAMTIQQDGWTSLLTLSVNGEAVIIGEPENSAEDISEPTTVDGETTIGYLDNSYRMHRFSERVYLNAGENEVVLHAAPRTNKTAEEIAEDPYKVGYYIDYISFAPVSDSVSVSDTAVSGTVVYPEAVSGTVFVAAYSGSKLVGAGTVVLSNESLADISASCIAAPDTVKVFLLSNLADFKPLAGLKTFTVTE